MTVQKAEPLPECLGGCGAPMLREVFAALDGTCSSCQQAGRIAAVQLEIAERYP